MSFDMLFTPMKIGNVEIKNRVVMAPMCMGFGQYNGCATETMMNYYEERAKGGVGLIFTEITRINDLTGASSFGQLGMSHDYQIPALKEMADRIHKHGCKVMVELHHPGRQNLGLMMGTVPICVVGDKILGKAYTEILTKGIIPPGRKLQDKNIVPRVVSPSKCEKSKMSQSVNRPLSNKAVKRLIAQFVEGAVRVKKAGCDGVELHAAHGYLIQQFLSPNTNKRTDEYGGSLENRMRFLCEIIDGIRKNCGKDFPIVVRLSVDEMYDKIGQKGKGYGLDEGL
ncbi:MAG: enoate reductase, partial [Eubacterium sp.]